MLAVLTWALPAGTAPDATTAGGRERLEHILAALEPLRPLLRHLTIAPDAAGRPEIRITGANLRIVNGLGVTDTTTGLGNLLVGYQVAELALVQVEVKIAKGDYLGIYEEKKITLAQFAKEYLAYADANKSAGATIRDRMSLKPLLAAFPDYLSTITPKAIEGYKAQCLQRVKPATANRELALLKHIFTKAIEWSYVKENPAKAVKLLKEPPGRVG